MITIKKLSSLPPGTMLRKCARILDESAWMLRNGDLPDAPFIRQVCSLVARTPDERTSTETRAICLEVHASRDFTWRSIADAALLLHADLGIEQADWDFRERTSGELDGSHRLVMPFTVVLDRLRSPFNVGSVFRSADSFGVSRVLMVSPGASADHPRAQRSARGCTRTVPWQEFDEEAVVGELLGQPVFALELGGQDLASFSFPERGTVIIGSEELGVSPRLLEVADRSLGRVSIGLYGSKGSLNVSVAFGILLHMWHLCAKTPHIQGNA